MQQKTAEKLVRRTISKQPNVLRIKKTVKIVKNQSSLTNGLSSIEFIKKYKIYFLVVCLMVIVTVLVGLWLLRGGEYAQSRTAMQQYLKNKYGREFLVDNLRTEGQGFGIEGDVVGDAKLAGDTDTFRVWESSRGVYNDTYPEAAWGKSESPKLKVFVSNNGMTYDSSRVKITVDSSRLAAIKSLSILDSMLTIYPQDIDYGVYVTTSRKGGAVTSGDIVSLRKLADYAKNRNGVNYSVRYVINSSGEDTRKVCQYYGGSKNSRLAIDISSDAGAYSCFREIKGKE